MTTAVNPGGVVFPIAAIGRKFQKSLADRAINHLARRAIEAAAAAAAATIRVLRVQAAMDRLPWLNSLAA
jgi:hypothetical protein